MSVKPRVAYRASNFFASWKKQTTFPSLFAYAGIPYQVLGKSCGAVVVTIWWTFLARARSDSGIVAILSRIAFSPAARSLFIRCSAFSSRARSFIAAFSKSLNPLLLFAAFLVLLSFFIFITLFFFFIFIYLY